MSGSLILWTVLALTLCWSVGVHNRLMRMRARGLSAFGSVEKHMRQYAELVREHVLEPDARPHPGTGHAGRESPGDLDRLLRVLQALDHALKDARANPLAIEPLGHLASAFEAAQDAWRHLQNVPVDLAGPVVPDVVRGRWDAITQRVETARGGFNQILTKYNEALGQFPARLVVGLMGFRPGGML